MQARGIWEQLFFGSSSYQTRGFNEFGAEQMLHNVGGRTYNDPPLPHEMKFDEVNPFVWA